MEDTLRVAWKTHYGGTEDTLQWHGRHITGGMGDTLWVAWETHYSGMEDTLQ